MVSEASSISRDGSNIASEADRIAQYEAHIRQQDLIFVDRVKRFLWIIVRACLVIGISFIILYPILMKISSALKDWDDLYNPMVVWLPEHVTMENFRMAYKVLNYVPTLTNSFLLSAVTMVTTVLSCALAGYGFARFNFKGNNLLFALVILTILVPTQTLMVPLYMHFRYFDPLGLISLFNGGKSLNLVNTYAPTIMLSLTANGLKAGLFVYIFRQFFRGLPKEVEEAAIIDGAGVYQTFFRVMLPNAVPAIVTVMLFSFVWQFNDVFYSSMFMSQSKLISLALSTIGGSTAKIVNDQLGQQEGAVVDPAIIQTVVDAGILLAIVPLIILYVFVQRWFVESVERTGIVG